MDLSKDAAGAGEPAAVTPEPVPEPPVTQTKTSISNQTDPSDDSSFANQPDIAEGDEPTPQTETATPIPPPIEEPPAVQVIHEKQPPPSIAEPINHVHQPTSHTDTDSSQPAALHHLDSDNNLISTCHVEDITVGCLKCQAKSAERLAVGEVIDWETIHQQHIHESEDDSEGGLEMPVRRPSQATVVPQGGPHGFDGTGPAKDGEDVPDTNDIGFTPEPFEKLGVEEDPFEKLKRDSMSHTSSFPVVPDPETAGADPTANSFGVDSTTDDPFFGNTEKEEKPVEPSDLNFFGDEGAAGDDFFANVGTNGGTSQPALERSETADLVMGGNVALEGEDNRFTEGMPLFGDQGATEDDFFARSKTPIVSSPDDDGTTFFDNPAALQRKSTAFVSGLPEPTTSTEEPSISENKPQEDVASKWKAALLDDDDLFGDLGEEGEDTAAPETPATPAWFDDSEDFLLGDDGDNSSAFSAQPSNVTSHVTSQSATSRYAPSQTPSQQYPTSIGTPTIPVQAPGLAPASSPYAVGYAPPYRMPDPPKSEPPKPQSFVDKTSGYASPYDLPEDIVKPIRKKPAPVQQPPAYASNSYYGPPSSTSVHSGSSLFSPGPPGGLGSPADIRAGPGYTGQPAPPGALPGRVGMSPTPGALLQKAVKPHASSDFFAELPVTLPKRPPSSTSNRYAPAGRVPGGGGPMGPPPTSAPMSMNRTPSYTGPPSRPTSVEPAYGSPPIGSLGAPQQYGISPALGHSPLARTSSPYGASPHGAATSNYAPKPANTASVYVSPPTNGKGPLLYAQRLNAPPSAPTQTPGIPGEGRHPPYHGQDAVGLGLSSAPEGIANGHPVTARPPSRERPGTMDSMKAHALGGVAEEDEEGNGLVPSAFNKALPLPPTVSSSRYHPTNRQTPPPTGANPALSHLTSPPTRTQSPGRYTPTNYQTHTTTSSISSSVLSPSDAITGFAPPKRSATQSPGFAAFRSANVGIQRPNSAAAHATSTYSNTYSPIESRRPSFPIQNVYPTAPAPTPQNFMAPPPGSIAASDPLERWKGAPLFCWGFGGSLVTMFPVHTSRWNAETGQQMIKTSLGEVKNRPSKDVLKEDDFFEDLGKFPGPVFGGKAGNKGRKKEISTWMETKILKLEGEYTRYRNPRSMEKVILWKMVKLCLENDGMLVGKKEVDDAVRQIISPESDTLELPRPKNALQQSTVFDMSALEAIRTHLVKGDREAAVWFAIENRQWAHAILISSTTSPELYKRTVQEFVKQEIKHNEGAERPGMESLAVLYEVFAGNWEESIDDLVPASTRMGMTMMTTTGGQNGNGLQGLEKWRETLGLMLSNRSNNDIQAIAKLGSLLESYDRVEAAHICYLFSMPAAVFSGAEESNKTAFALLGANHVNNPFNYGRDLDAIILSEIYEYAISLIPGAPPLTNFPHLLPFKLHHANVLAQYGFTAEATKYINAIPASFKVTNRPQPYLHPLLLSSIDELAKRLSQAPRDSGSGSWISKPNLETISGNLFSKFSDRLTDFVIGSAEDGKDGAGTGTMNGGLNGSAEGEAGLFAKLATTPDMTRVHSGQDLYGIGQGGYTPYNPAQPPLGTSPMGMAKQNSSASNRYAPKAGGSGTYTPAPTSQPKTAEPATPIYGGYGGYDSTPAYGGYGGYEPSPQATPYQSAEKPAEAPNGYPGYQPSPMLQTAPPMSPPSFDSGYSTFGPSGASATTTEESGPAQTGGYEPPSYGGGYEPPTTEFQPYMPSSDHSDDEGAGAKKKGSTMGGDDDIAAANKKKREQEEEENRKMIAAIAEKEKEEEERKKKEAKGGSWFPWFGAKKDPNLKAYTKATLGDESSFYYDPELRRWMNKKGGTDSTGVTPSGTPPPPRRLGSPAQIGGPPSGPPSGVGSPRPGTSSSIESIGVPKPPTSAPPTSAPTSSPGGLMPPPPGGAGASRDPSPNRPPPRPATTGKVDEMEELLGSGGSVRKPAAKAKGRKRYVEVFT
ncbi:hypothetical protein ABW20_dc0109033 [Dactylellina cionopaga]|nr:hypothetical protein ABW20_dc0109033 [Dactylellina cionopaga]